MSSIFPFLDGSADVDTTLTSTELPLFTEYDWDFEKNDFKLTNGKCTIVTGIDALRVWIYHTLKTSRYKHAAYSWDYGQEFDNVIGSVLPRNVIISEVTRYVKECLMVNAYITSVTNVTVTFDNEVVNVTATVATIYGEVTTSV